MSELRPTSGTLSVLPWTMPVRIGVVGLGYWGPNLVRNIYELPEAELVAVCHSRREATDALRRRFPGVHPMSAYVDLLDSSVEAGVISTPGRTHFELAAAALHAGKHVFVEKPLAASAEEAAELIRLAENNGLILMPGHTFLYSPAVNHIRSLIQGGELGEIYFVSTSRVNLGLHQSDVSVAWDLGPHDFSILRFWLGETPDSISALSRACVIPGMPDVAFINMEFPSQ